MGSLMAGWQSTEKDLKTVMYQRNKSLTREEIDAYWKSRKTTVDDPSGNPAAGNENQENIHKAEVTASKKTQRSSSFPLIDRKDSLNSDSKMGDMLSSKTCWWTRSNLAFLNEPPVIATEGPHKYASQYSVAKFGSSQATNN